MITIRAAGADDLATVRALLRDYAASLPSHLALRGFEAELAALPHPYVAPHGLFMLVREDDVVVGVGAYRPFGDDIAELKRIYLVPAVRGRGLGRQLLEALIERARAAGYRRLRLDSDRATMGAAIALYRALGFGEIEPYGPDFDGALAFYQLTLAAR